jgi:hypothetical protein
MRGALDLGARRMGLMHVKEGAAIHPHDVRQPGRDLRRRPALDSDH